MTISATPKILFIDAYDSFSNSIVGLIQATLDAYVHVIRIDDGQTAEDLARLIRDFDAVVVGPGPGNPANYQDVGVSRFLWTLGEADLIPVLGICLGFQSMGLAFGAQVATLREARHGCVCSIIHKDSDIFEGVGELLATQYHSLQVVLEHDLDGFDLEECDSAPMIQPLAYTADAKNGNVLMALKVRNKPFWGIQFHPESVCTSENAHYLISNWWKLSRTWLEENRRTEQQSQRVNAASYSDVRSKTSMPDSLLSQIRAECPSLFPIHHPSVNWQVTSSAGITVSDIYEKLGLHDGDNVLLDAQGHSSGRYSIIGITQSSRKIEMMFGAAHRILTLVTGPSGRPNATELRVKSQQEFWDVIGSIMAANAIDASAGPIDIPFWGGFIGYVSYEAGLDTLDIAARADGVRDGPVLPDIFLTWITRSIVVDHSTEHIYILHLEPDGAGWAGTIAQRIDALAQDRLHRPSQDNFHSSASALDRALDKSLEDVIVEKPVLENYCNKVGRCKRYLAVGESYELCLTDQTKIYLPLSSGDDDAVHDWTLYKRLREANRAPFGAFLKTKRFTVVGSSPERFLRWTRSGRCQFRPIKGTVKKSPEVDLEAATKFLSSQKERAENLMIVDLIRHDLSGIVGSANCFVPELMKVEEYQTVFQLVSVIEGQIPRSERPDDNDTCQKNRSSGCTSGIDVLVAALPPGSMTGAPKKRSCELLMQLEDEPRGIYSGVLGYLDLGGGGDFSVVIRTAVKRRGEVVHKLSKSATSRAPLPHQVWRVGAGGAVTIQSTEIGEFEEMETKLDSVLQAFNAG